MSDEFVYIKFRVPSENIEEVSPEENRKKSWPFLARIMMKFMDSNPEFGKLIDFVDTWKIEYNKTVDAPWREIGIDQQGKIILAMPLRKDYGYWTDNNLKLEDFEDDFGAVFINQSDFEQDWQSFVDQNE